MALEVGFQEGRKYIVHLQIGYGEYWFMYPMFKKLSEQTNEQIDLYGDAEFSQYNIHHLERVVKDIEELIKSKPEDWDVDLGGYRKAKINKTEFQTKINTLKDLIIIVKNDASKTLYFLGD